MKGLQTKTPFYDCLTRKDRELVDELAEIEREDADRCANCGGEDCVCCEYYLDRQKWKDPEELFPYANADSDIPGIDSTEFVEWVEYNGYEDWDPDEAYREFREECLEELRD